MFVVPPWRGDRRRSDVGVPDAHDGRNAGRAGVVVLPPDLVDEAVFADERAARGVLDARVRVGAEAHPVVPGPVALDAVDDGRVGDREVPVDVLFDPVRVPTLSVSDPADRFGVDGVSPLELVGDDAAVVPRLPVGERLRSRDDERSPFEAPRSLQFRPVHRRLGDEHRLPPVGGRPPVDVLTVSDGQPVRLPRRRLRVGVGERAGVGDAVGPDPWREGRGVD